MDGERCWRGPRGIIQARDGVREIGELKRSCSAPLLGSAGLTFSNLRTLFVTCMTGVVP